VLVDLLDEATRSPDQRLGPCDLVSERNQQLRNLVVLVIRGWASAFTVRVTILYVASGHGTPGVVVTDVDNIVLPANDGPAPLSTKTAAFRPDQRNCASEPHAGVTAT